MPDDPTDPSALLTYEHLKAAGLLFPHSHSGEDVSWGYLEKKLATELSVGLDLEPEFQRAHRWTDEQRVAYIEHVLVGGETGRTLIFAIVGKNDNLPKSGVYKHYAIIDGKQRMETIRRFLRGEFRVFAGLGGKAEGWLSSELDRSLMRSMGGVSLRWQLVLVSTYVEMMELYLKFNRGGTPHTAEELDKVEALIAREAGAT